MNLNNKKEMVSRIAGVGKGRVRFNPEKLEDIEDAVTRAEIRSLISQGTIKLNYIKGQTRRSKTRKSGPGSRKGKKSARMGKKEKWVKQVRALRKYLKKVKPNISKKLYWDAYKKVKGGEIKSVARLKAYLGGSK
ncbi:MAG: 50S ribosomal protein L19e [Nitrososphaerota archaeon]|jgi:large subunit ribosomal protein L19e|nr:50S ribosomal protein L19e [Nitrososphaerota archaeon]MDG6926894.1 50S ribosomal protein L19e [Nitrososphaerota archaeon]MDG6929988.1 50S ribosomal protein L19e [Nitrososphaerota archaeon]MDG6931939.1 50S ribosomal protein L19e [Nitrososphaerota archaeon]MDG6943858.1 50S ribosomal protein L19e [Nitrososphaerota archaeon]